MNKRTEPRILLGQAIVAMWLAVLFVQTAFTMGDPEFAEYLGSPMSRPS